VKCAHRTDLGLPTFAWHTADGIFVPSHAPACCTMRCVRCGEALPFGPAKLDGEHAAAVAIEMRAAEIASAAATADQEWALYGAEFIGWRLGKYGGNPGPRESSAWPAWHIAYEHEARKDNTP
jgi:hypothetical protein